MPEVIQTVVYRFDELSDPAKEKARSWYREGAFDYEWFDAVFEDFETVCDILGIHLKTRSVPLMGGGSRQKPCIWFSGFSSQGDGACCEGCYSYAKGAARAIRGYAPNDAELHAIADTLQSVQQRNFYQLHADIDHRGHYYHEYCMAISVERDSLSYQPMTADAEETVIEALRDLARWLYRQLRDEYRYLTSDETVDEIIVANEYTFTRAGRRFG